MIEADITAIVQLVDAGMPRHDALDVVQELARVRDELLAKVGAERDRALRLLNDAIRALEARKDRAARRTIAARLRGDLMLAIEGIRTELARLGIVIDAEAWLAAERADELADQFQEVG